jgi:hypothetical protein
MLWWHTSLLCIRKKNKKVLWYFKVSLYFTATYLLSGAHYLLCHSVHIVCLPYDKNYYTVTTNKKPCTTSSSVQLVGNVKEAFHVLYHLHQTHSTHTSQTICCLQCSVMLPTETFKMRKSEVACWSNFENLPAVCFWRHTLHYVTNLFSNNKLNMVTL